MISDRAPINSYDQALWRMVEHFEAHGIVIAPREELPIVAQIVSEIYWVTPGRVRSDLIKAQASLRGFGPPRTRRRA